MLARLLSLTEIGGGKANHAWGRGESATPAWKKRKGPGIIPSPFSTAPRFGGGGAAEQRCSLDRACALHDVDPSLDAALDRLEGRSEEHTTEIQSPYVISYP